VYTDLQEALEKPICSSHATIEQLLALQQESLGKYKNQKHFARGKIKLVN
jgi:hypothetical protein